MRLLFVVLAACRPTPADFLEQARRLSNTIGCAERQSELAHCNELAPLVSAQRTYAAAITAAIAPLLPERTPTTVVYPFGGGDLMGALIAFPNATEITTISLEYAGEPATAAIQNGPSIAKQAYVLKALLSPQGHATGALNDAAHADLPGQLLSFLLGLSVLGYEPTALRYFKLEPDGVVHYLTKHEIEALSTTIAPHLDRKEPAPKLSLAFANSELAFRPRGGGATRVHRHIAADVSNQGLAHNPSLLAYLKQRGKFAVLMKATHYLPWQPEFEALRSALLAQASVLVSDGSGIPVSFTEPTGFKTETLGKFHGAMWHDHADAANDAMIALWAKNPYRPLTERYGYPDVDGCAQLMVATRR